MEGGDVKLSLKLTLWIVLGVTLVLSAFAALRVQRQITMFEADMKADHRAFGRALASAASEVAREHGRERALALIEDANLRESHMLVRWVGEAREEPVSQVEGVGEARRLVTQVPVRMPFGATGSIELSESLQKEGDHVRQTIVRAVISTLTTIAVCGMIILVFGWVFVGRPVDQLIGTARHVGAGDLSRRVRLAQRDEIGALANAMNSMCDDLAEARRHARAEHEARIRALEQLRHAERLATVGQLASGLAHELGTPLNVVQARARMIDRGESTGEHVLRDAQVIDEQTKRMTAIIRQLLDFARPRSPIRQPVVLQTLLGQSLALLEPLARRRDVKIVLDVPDDPIEVHVDGQQLEQVLANLVLNAVQARPKDGQVRVELSVTERLDPLRREPGTWARIAVEDHGEGMPQEVAAHVFEPFFTTKDVGHGTGLGLSVAWGIVTEHGGSIEVESEPQQGSRFSVYLPMTAAAAGPARSNELPSSVTA